MGKARGDGDIGLAHGSEVVIAIADEDHGLTLMLETLHDTLFLDDTGYRQQTVVARDGLRTKPLASQPSQRSVAHVKPSDNGDYSCRYSS